MSTLTCRDRRKCSIISGISWVICSIESSGAEGRVCQAGDGAGETGWPGGDGGMCAMMRVVAVVMVMVVVVVVVLKELHALHVHSPSSCRHREPPVSLVSSVPHAQAQVCHGD
jgi:hypothetical protein